MRSTVEYRGVRGLRSISIVIDAYAFRSNVSDSGEVTLRTIDGGHIADLAPAEARHLAAQLVAAADVADS